MNALYEAVRSRKGVQLFLGLDFILRFMRAVIPSPIMTRQISKNFTSLAVRRQLAKDEVSGEGLLAALAMVGPELRGEAAKGVAAAIVAMLSSGESVMRESGAELLAYPDLIGLADDENGRVFWRDVRHEVVKKESSVVRDASVKHHDVARMCFLEVGAPRELLKVHGPTVVLARTSLSMAPGTGPSIAARVLDRWRGRRRDDVAIELFSGLGELLVGAEVPQLPPASLWVADVGLVEAIAKLPVSGVLPNRAVAGLWLTAAAALEWKAAVDRRRSVGLGPFSESGSREIRAIGIILGARLGFDGPEVSDTLAGLGLERAAADRIARWSSRTSSLIARR